MAATWYFKLVGFSWFLLVVIISECPVKGQTIDDMISREWDRGLFSYPSRTSSRKFYLMQLDMILTATQWKQIKAANELKINGTLSRQKRKGTKFRDWLWKKGEVPYEITEHDFDDSEKNLIYEAIDVWQAYTCVTFVNFKNLNTTRRSRIRFWEPTGGGCSSGVGQQYRNSPQNINLGQYCRTKPIIVHEIGHALGLYHEHMRSDRKDYVNINMENVREGQTNNFVEFDETLLDVETVPYDLVSIMHYGKLFMSKNRTANLYTIEPHNAEYLDKIGKAESASFTDIKMVNHMYKCAARCASNITCPPDGFLGKDCRCFCPSNSDGTAVEDCRDRNRCEPPDVNGPYIYVHTQGELEEVHADQARIVEYTMIDVLCKGDMSYTLVGNLTCINGAWTGYLPDCISENCIVPAVENGRMDYEGQNYRPLQEYALHEYRVTVTCSQGYELIRGQDYLNTFETTCQLGNFTDSPLASCVEARCDINPSDTLLVTIEDERFEGTKVEHGTRVMFSCRNGYEFTESTDRNVNASCSKSELNQPTCRPKNCIAPAAENGQMYYGNNRLVRNYANHGSTVTVKCSQGYELIRGHTYLNTFETTCQLGNFTDHHLASCVEERCSFAEKGNTIIRIPGQRKLSAEVSVLPNTSVEFGCPFGYAFSSNSGTTQEAMCRYGVLVIPRCVKTLGDDDLLCKRSTYGCCSDGETSAQGKNNFGCPSACENTRYGCCDDNVTATQGPDQEGCDDIEIGGSGDKPSCELTRYGCCPDKVTAVEDGCPMIEMTTAAPSVDKDLVIGAFLPDQCLLDKETGPCRDNLTVLWYYNREEADCRQFWYGGCQGNQNRFKSQKECQTTCKGKSREVTREQVCHLPSETGPCRSYLERWHFNTDTRQCEKFTYGGCGGNQNNFENEETCQRYCRIERVVDTNKRPRASCDVPTVSDGSISKIGMMPEIKNGTVVNGTTVEVLCSNHYELKAASGYIGSFEATCDEGDWSDKIFPHCVGKRCFINNGTLIPNIAPLEKTVFEDRELINISCIEWFQFKKRDLAPNKTITRMCKKGKVSYPVCIEERCKTWKVTNGKLHKAFGNKIWFQYGMAKHGVELEVKCDKDYNLTLAGHPLDIFTARCHYGAWNNPIELPKCIIGLTTELPEIETTAGQTTISDTPTSPEATSPTAAWQTATSPSPTPDHIDDSGSDIKESEGNCTVPQSKMQYTSSRTASNGEVIVALCPFDVSVYSSYEYDYTEENITCIDGQFEGSWPSCKEIETSCSNLQNGTVLYKYSRPIVTCDEGFSLHVNEHSIECIDGALQTHTGREVKCFPDHCLVPSNHEGRRIFHGIRNSEILEEQKIVHQDWVHISCSEPKKEPAYRQFICVAGKWKVDGRTVWDTVRENDTFPECRAAVCSVPCENEGVCIRDNVCDCPAGTQLPNCDAELEMCQPPCQNGGTCVNGQCQCSADTTGNACQTVCNGGRPTESVFSEKWIHEVNNPVEFKRRTLPQCVRKCVKYKKFLCRAVSFGRRNSLDARNTCILHTVSPSDAHSQMKDRRGWKVVTLEC